VQVELSSEVIKLLKKYRANHKDGILDFMGTSDTRVVNSLLKDKLSEELKEKKP
jgi:Rod binding domain-containing protein